MQIHRMNNEEFRQHESGELNLFWVCKMDEAQCTKDNPCDGCWGMLR